MRHASTHDQPVVGEDQGGGGGGGGLGRGVTAERESNSAVCVTLTEGLVVAKIELHRNVSLQFVQTPIEMSDKHFCE